MASFFKSHLHDSEPYCQALMARKTAEKLRRLNLLYILFLTLFQDSYIHWNLAITKDGIFV